MLLKMSKAKKAIFAFFSLFLSGLLFIPVAALDYSKLPIDVIDSLQVSTVFNDLIRKASFAILKTFATIVDSICEAVEYISSANAYNLLMKAFPNHSLVMPIALAVISFAVCLAGLFLMFNADKLKISDTLKNIFVAAIFIFALPSFIGACNEIRTKGVSSSKSIAQTAEYYASNSNGTINDNLSEITSQNGMGVRHYLGEQIISKNMLDIDKTKNDLKTHYLSESDDYKTTPNYIYNMNYNRTLNPQEWTEKVINIYDITQYSEGGSATGLSDYDVATLVGFSYYYNIYMNNRIRQADQYGSQSIYIQYSEEARDDRGNYTSITRTIRENEYLNNILIPAILNCDSVKEAIARGVLSVSDISSCTNYQAVNTVLKNRVTPLITVSRKTVESSDLNNGVYYAHTMPLFTQAEWEDMKDINSLSELGDYLAHVIKNLGSGVEYLYAYKIDFWKTLITLILVAIALLFAGIKLAGMLYDMLFMNLIAPVVVATDVYGSGRAKKMIQELLNTYIVFFLVILVLNLYITTVTVVMTSNINFIAQLMLILAGAKFVIDGPDIIVKLTGTDAGVKSGYGALMGLRSAAAMTTGAVRTAARTTKQATHIAGKATGGVAGGVAGGITGATAAVRNSREHDHGAVMQAGAAVRGAVSGVVGGAFSGAFGNRQQGGNAINRGTSTGNRIGSFGNDNSHSTGSNTNSTSSSTSDSSSTTNNNTNTSTNNTQQNAQPQKSQQQDQQQTAKGEKGDKGDRGEQGFKGDKGDKDVQSDSSKAENKDNVQSTNSNDSQYGNAFAAPPSSPNNASAAPESAPAAPTYAESEHSSEQNSGFAQIERRNENAAPHDNNNNT